jgi:hypothetical protein
LRKWLPKRTVRWDNILFDDAYNIVGVIDWEYPRSAPFEAFQAVSGQLVFFMANYLSASFAPHTAAHVYIVSYSHIAFNLFYPKSIANSSSSCGVGVDFLIFLFLLLPPATVVMPS